MVSLKTSKELLDMKLSCQISAQALKLAGELIRPGVSTAHVNKMVHEFIVSQGAKPTFLGYGGFPAACCISVNDEVIHGIPSDRIIREGDIVSVDVGAAINGYTGDNAATFAAGVVSDEARKIMEISHRRDNTPVRVTTPMHELVERASTQNFVPVVEDKDTFIGIITRRSIIQFCMHQFFREDC